MGAARRDGIGSVAGGLAAGLLDLVFAPICLGCDGPSRGRAPRRLICPQCRARLRPIPPPACPRCGAPRLRTGRPSGPTCPECEAWPPWLRAARSAFLLHPPADRLVHQLKYRGWRALAEPLAEYMAAVPVPAAAGDGPSLVVPIPTTRRRLRERGYNQAELLARGLARHTGRTVIAALERVSAAASQTALQPAARRANVAGSFRVAGDLKAVLTGRHLLLVDDVLTTGATVLECGATLVAAGVRAISVLTFARALDVGRLIET
ncbi:MAG TPA: ComF family protein [Longimicrobiales bacterium]